MTKDIAVLLVDDEPFNLEILEEYLEDTEYQTEVADSGEAALAKLQENPSHFDVVLLDRMMPGMSGIDVLRQMKQDKTLKHIPVVLQTAMVTTEDITAGLDAGAYYYLTKPFEEEMLLSVVKTAVEDHLRYRELQKEIDMTARMFGLMQSASYRYKTLADARNLAIMLANACPDPARSAMGLQELMVNAVEHGNLAITYEEKSILREAGTWDEEIERRMQDELYGQRYVSVEFTRESSVVRIIVTDEGDGFDWQKYLEFDPDRAFDSHGRGIAMSKAMSFDDLRYIGKGNQVVVSLYLN